MSRYRIALGLEGEYQPGLRRRVLRNKLGITRKRVMDQAEYNALVAVETRYMALITHETCFTADLLCQMHRDWLGDIYEWAGQYRTVDIAKDGFSWPRAFRVPDNMARFSREMLAIYTPCRGVSRHEVAHAMAMVHAELLLIHPFREGNGRLARILADLMAVQAGYPLPGYQFTGRGSCRIRDRYLHAVQEGYV